VDYLLNAAHPDNGGKADFLRHWASNETGGPSWPRLFTFWHKPPK
jgi:hypothetical protein